MERRFCTKATRVCNTTLRTDRVWACMHECVCTWTCIRVSVCENGGLASLGACLVRTGQRYRENEDQEGAKRKLGVQRGLKASLCKDWKRRTSKKCKKYKVNGLTHMCMAIHVALAEQNLLSKWKSSRDPEEIISFPIIDTFYKTINNFSITYNGYFESCN